MTLIRTAKMHKNHRRKNPVAKALSNPVCRPKVEADRTKYRREKLSARDCFA